jgi:hypothetical protein
MFIQPIIINSPYGPLSSGQAPPPPVAPPSWPAASWYVSPSGSSSNSGTSASPWSFSYALGGAAGQIASGDVIELAPGYYNIGNLSTSLQGTSTSPILFRAEYRTRVQLDGTITLLQTGGYLHFLGIELYRSVIDANIIGMVSHAVGCKFIHCIIHDHPSNGLAMWMEGSDQEAYGNIIYNNGYSGQDPTHSAHGIYTQNNTGTKRLAANIMFGNYGYGIHMYSSDAAYVRGYTTEDNICINNGVGNHVSMTGGMNFLIESGNSIDNLVFRRNIGFLSPGWDDSGGKLGSIFEPGVAQAGGSVTDNFFMGKTYIGFWHNMTFQRNEIFQRENYDVLAKYLYDDQPPIGGIWDNNKYHNVNGYTNAYASVDSLFAQVNRDFGPWKTAMSVDASSTADTVEPQDKIVVIPSEYIEGYAHIYVLNFSGQASVSVDFSSFLSINDQYEILNAQNFFGAALQAGTYAGGNVNITLVAQTPPASVSGKAVMDSTGTELNVFVVRKIF